MRTFKKHRLAIFAIFATLFASMLIITMGMGVPDGAEPLKLCIEWWEGFTGHLDGIALAQGAAGSMTEAVKAKLEELSAEFKKISDLEEKVQELTKEAKGAAEVKEEINKRVNDYAKAIDDFKAEMTERQDEFETKAKQPASGPGQTGVGAALKAAIAESGLSPDRKGKAEFDVDLARFEGKAITNLSESAGPLIIPQYDQQLIPLPREMPHVRDLLNARTAESPTIIYFRHLATTGSAATQENQLDLKAEVDMTFEQITANLAQIADWTYVARQMLDDVPYLRGVIEGELRFLVEIEEDRQLLNGDGLNGDMEGLNEVATAYDATLDNQVGVVNIQNMDVLRLAALQVALAFFPPSGYILNPIDAAGIELLKTSENAYLWVNPMSPGGLRPWGLPLVQTTQQTADEFTTGAFNLVDYWQKGSVMVEISTEDGDNFRRNRATVLAEKRATLAVKRPTSIVHGTFTLAKA